MKKKTKKKTDAGKQEFDYSRIERIEEELGITGSYLGCITSASSGFVISGSRISRIESDIRDLNRRVEILQRKKMPFYKRFVLSLYKRWF